MRGRIDCARVQGSFSSPHRARRFQSSTGSSTTKTRILFPKPRFSHSHVLQSRCRIDSPTGQGGSPWDLLNRGPPRKLPRTLRISVKVAKNWDKRKWTHGNQYGIPFYEVRLTVPETRGPSVALPLSIPHQKLNGPEHEKPNSIFKKYNVMHIKVK